MDAMWFYVTALQIAELCKHIHDTYISLSGPAQVNIDYTSRTNITGAFKSKKLSKTMFAAAQRQVSHHISHSNRLT